GTTVKPENVVTETLRRVTDPNTADDKASLSTAILGGLPDQADHSTILRHPIAAWMETTLGLQREDNDPKGKWVRTRRPRTLADAAGLLASASGRPVFRDAASMQRLRA